MTFKILLASAAAAALLGGGFSGALATDNKMSNTTTGQVSAGMGMDTYSGGLELIDPQGITRLQGTAAPRLVGSEVYDRNGEHVGDISFVVGGPGEQAQGVTIVTDQPLGFGERTVMLGAEHLTVHGDRVSTSLSADEIDNLPKFDFRQQ